MRTFEVVFTSTYRKQWFRDNTPKLKLGLHNFLLAAHSRHRAGLLVRIVGEVHRYRVVRLLTRRLPRGWRRRGRVAIATGATEAAIRRLPRFRVADACADGVRLRHVETEHGDGGAERESGREENYLDVGARRCEICGQEGEPYDERRVHAQHDVLRLVEVVRKRPRFERVAGAHDDQNEVVAERADEASLWQPARHLNERLGRDGHAQTSLGGRHDDHRCCDHHLRST